MYLKKEKDYNYKEKEKKKVIFHLQVYISINTIDIPTLNS